MPRGWQTDLCGQRHRIAEPRVIRPTGPAPPPVLRTAEDHLRKLQQLGIQFIKTPSLARVVQNHFTPVVNETPARLARTRPTPKREFVTAEDVWRVASHGGTILTHAHDAVITDQARDQAAMKGIELRPA